MRFPPGGDVQRIHEQVDALLGSEDGLVVLFDGRRMVSYVQGFSASPCQLELLSVALEHAVRSVIDGQTTDIRRNRRNREKSEEGDGRGRRVVLRRPLGGPGRRDDSSVVDGGGQSVHIGDAAGGNSSRAAGRVLRLASKTTQANP